jgi:lysophospholipase L1-like esterase
VKTILCYGDSNTYGTMPIDVDILEKAFIPINYRFPKKVRWTGVLQSELGTEYEVIEEGLNSRTTVWDDPVDGIHKNGLKYLLPCLESHAPIDLVVLMLGTNDLKARFSLSAYDIAASIGVLVNTIQKSGSGPEGKAPEILILSPAHIGMLTNFVDLFDKKSVEESNKLADNYRKIANLFNCKFMDASKHIKTSEIDGVHFNAKDLENFGR